MLIVGCAAHNPRLFVPSAVPRAVALDAPELAYVLDQVEIVAESPLPGPEGVEWSYKILGATQQGDCVSGCPRSTILVTTSSYRGPAPDVRLYRIDGIRFWEFGGITKYVASVPDEPFLAFTVTSKVGPGDCHDFEVRVGVEGASVAPLGRNVADDWCR